MIILNCIDINNIGVLYNTDKQTRDKFINLSTLKKYKKRQVIIGEKVNIDNIYILVDGKVSISKMNEDGELKIIFILSSGDLINEVTLGRERASTVTCEAFEDSIVAEIPMSDFLDLMKNDFTLTKNVLDITENRVRRLYRQLKNSISLRIDKKLAAKLCRLSREFGIKGDEWTYIDLNITITYLADMLGTKRETLSRAMKTLQNKGLIKYEGKNISVKSDELVKYFKE